MIWRRSVFCLGQVHRYETFHRGPFGRDRELWGAYDDRCSVGKKRVCEATEKARGREFATALAGIEASRDCDPSWSHSLSAGHWHVAVFLRCRINLVRICSTGKLAWVKCMRWQYVHVLTNGFGNKFRYSIVCEAIVRYTGRSFRNGISGRIRPPVDAHVLYRKAVTSKAPPAIIALALPSCCRRCMRGGKEGGFLFGRDRNEKV